MQRAVSKSADDKLVTPQPHWTSPSEISGSTTASGGPRRLHGDDEQSNVQSILMPPVDAISSSKSDARALMTPSDLKSKRRLGSISPIESPAGTRLSGLTPPHGPSYSQYLHPSACSRHRSRLRANLRVKQEPAKTKSVHSTRMTGASTEGKASDVAAGYFPLRLGTLVLWKVDVLGRGNFGVVYQVLCGRVNSGAYTDSASCLRLDAHKNAENMIPLISEVQANQDSAPPCACLMALKVSDLPWHWRDSNTPQKMEFSRLRILHDAGAAVPAPCEAWVVKDEGDDDSSETVKGWSLCLLMELVEGVTLREWLNAQPGGEFDRAQTRTIHPALTPKAALERLNLSVNLVEALEVIHRVGVVVDLKPRNLIVRKKTSSMAFTSSSASSRCCSPCCSSPNNIVSPSPPSSTSPALTHYSLRPPALESYEDRNGTDGKEECLSRSTLSTPCASECNCRCCRLHCCASSSIGSEEAWEVCVVDVAGVVLHEELSCRNPPPSCEESFPNRRCRPNICHCVAAAIRDPESCVGVTLSDRRKLETTCSYISPETAAFTLEHDWSRGRLKCRVPSTKEETARGKDGCPESLWINSCRPSLVAAQLLWDDGHHLSPLPLGFLDKNSSKSMSRCGSSNKSSISSSGAAESGGVWCPLDSISTVFPLGLILCEIFGGYRTGLTALTREKEIAENLERPQDAELRVAVQWETPGVISIKGRRVSFKQCFLDFHLPDKGVLSARKNANGNLGEMVNRLFSDCLAFKRCDRPDLWQVQEQLTQLANVVKMIAMKGNSSDDSVNIPCKSGSTTASPIGGFPELRF